MYACVGFWFLAVALKYCSSSNCSILKPGGKKKRGIYLRNTIILFSPVSHFTWLLPETIYLGQVEKIPLSPLLFYPFLQKFVLYVIILKTEIVWLKLPDFDLEIPPWQHLMWNKNLPHAHPVSIAVTLWSGDDLLWYITAVHLKGGSSYVGDGEKMLMK